MNNLHGQKGGALTWIIWGLILFIPLIVMLGFALGLFWDVFIFGSLALDSHSKYLNAPWNPRNKKKQ